MSIGPQAQRGHNSQDHELTDVELWTRQIRNEGPPCIYRATWGASRRNKLSIPGARFVKLG